MANRLTTHYKLILKSSRPIRHVRQLQAQARVHQDPGQHPHDPDPGIAQSLSIQARTHLSKLSS